MFKCICLFVQQASLRDGIFYQSQAQFFS